MLSIAVYCPSSWHTGEQKGPTEKTHQASTYLVDSFQSVQLSPSMSPWKSASCQVLGALGMRPASFQLLLLRSSQRREGAAPSVWVIGDPRFAQGLPAPQLFPEELSFSSWGLQNALGLLGLGAQHVYPLDKAHLLSVSLGTASSQGKGAL